jgi:DNA-binding Xre family transcriptional regulator
MQGVHHHDDWALVLAENPKVLWGLVADVVKAAKAGEGEKRTGRRPAVSIGSLDELYDVIFPTQFVTATFGAALTRLLAERSLSQHAFAKKSGMNQATVSRLVSGRTPPTVEHMEYLSHFLNVRPTYFAEYRALKLGQLVTDYLLANPAASAEAVREAVMS